MTENVISQKQIKEAAFYIKNKVESDNPKGTIPKIAIVCGSGFSKLGEIMKNTITISYSEIPNFPTTTVQGHASQLLIGIISKTPVILLQGRFHMYEGFSLGKVTMYVRVLKMLKIKYLVLSNAAGGVNPKYKAGDIMLFTDHINMGMFSKNSVLQPQETFVFKNKTSIYNKNLNKKCKDFLNEINFEGNIQNGVYGCVPGPNYETIAEVNFLKMFGVDAVGMSTIPEVLVAHDYGFKIIAFSLITNECIHSYEIDKEPNHNEVLEVCSLRTESLKKFAEKLVDFLKCYCSCPKNEKI